jgi:hypothetical protein
VVVDVVLEVEDVVVVVVPVIGRFISESSHTPWLFTFITVALSGTANDR